MKECGTDTKLKAVHYTSKLFICIQQECGFHKQEANKKPLGESSVMSDHVFIPSSFPGPLAFFSLGCELK